jgi:hypothetical protein
MKPRVCICCGEAISGAGETAAGNPNLCVRCFRLAEVAEAPRRKEPADLAPESPLAPSEPIPLRKAA